MKTISPKPHPIIKILVPVIFVVCLTLFVVSEIRKQSPYKIFETKVSYTENDILEGLSIKGIFKVKKNNSSEVFTVNSDTSTNDTLSTIEVGYFDAIVNSSDCPNVIEFVISPSKKEFIVGWRSTFHIENIESLKNRYTISELDRCALSFRDAVVKGLVKELEWAKALGN